VKSDEISVRQVIPLMDFIFPQNRKTSKTIYLGSDPLFFDAVAMISLFKRLSGSAGDLSFGKKQIRSLHFQIVDDMENQFRILSSITSIILFDEFWL
jgi:hypothetical protein